MLTVHAMVWNRYKGETLHQALSTRYVKVFMLAVLLYFVYVSTSVGKSIWWFQRNPTVE